MTTGPDDAVELLQRALVRFDAAGATDAADHLRGAIEQVRTTPPEQFEHELDAARAALDEERLRRRHPPKSNRLH